MCDSQGGVLGLNLTHNSVFVGKVVFTHQLSLHLIGLGTAVLREATLLSVPNSLLVISELFLLMTASRLTVIRQVGAPEQDRPTQNALP